MKKNSSQVSKPARKSVSAQVAQRASKKAHKKDRREKIGEAVVAAIDLGKRSSEICWLDAQSQVVERRRIASTPEAVEEVFGGKPRLRIAIETGGSTNWVRRKLEQLGHDVTVADAKRLKLIWETHSKDDRRDAHFLAEILLRRPELLNPVKPRSLETEKGRALLRMRESQVEARGRTLRGSVSRSDTADAFDSRRRAGDGAGIHARTR